MAELTVGQVVDGRYELEAVIGKGGMGCVFRARHVITHGKVALKVLTDTVDAELQQRFLAEARAASTIGPITASRLGVATVDVEASRAEHRAVLRLIDIAPHAAAAP